MGQQQQLALGARTIAAEKEAPVGLVKDQLRLGIAQVIAIELVRTVGFVALAKEQGAAVVGPGQTAVAFLEGQFGHHAGGQLLHMGR